MAVTVVAVGMVLGGAGAYIFFPGPEPAAAPPAAPAEAGTPQSLAKAVVDRLNAKDLNGVIELTCAQGKATGRRELISAIPALDPAAPPETRNASIQSRAGCQRVPRRVHRRGRGQLPGCVPEREMRIQRSGERWALCGMDSPRISGTGLVGSG